MIDTLHNFYLSRFGKLPVETQTRILERLDAGSTVCSTYDPASTTCTCLLTGDPSEALWSGLALSETEAQAVGEAVVGALNLMPRDFKTSIDEALDDGARLALIVEHSGIGRAQVVITKDGRSTWLADLKIDDPVFQ